MRLSGVMVRDSGWNEPASLHSSGDLIADRRYRMAREMLREGEAEAAADLALQIVQLAPAWAGAWLLLGEAERSCGRNAAAELAFRQVIDLDPRDRLGAGLHLARLSAGIGQAGMTAGYVATLFDGYAASFDRHLTGDLAYRGPAQIMAVLHGLGLLPEGRPAFTNVLDLGCGTGLMGEALRPHAVRLSGCDLSEGMLAVSRGKPVYERLVQADAVAFLAAEPPDSADLVTAADVMIYVGELRPVFEGVSRTLARGGHFALTVQTGPGLGFELGEDHRYRHAIPYAEEVAVRHGLPVVATDAVALRTERGEPVEGAVIVCRKPAS
jgi:predicted TPR repeat methyltransferase